MDLLDLLPPSVSLLDAVVAMHVTGPVDGSPFPLQMLAASHSAVALDTALYTLLQLCSGRRPPVAGSRQATCFPGPIREIWLIPLSLWNLLMPKILSSPPACSRPASIPIKLPSAW